jgi:hypothetical protein
MSIRVVAPADGSQGVTVSWDWASQVLPARQMLDVPPGSALETAIGGTNLASATAQQLASAANGTGGAVTN